MRILTLIAGALLFSSLPAYAAGNPDVGKLKAVACTACHISPDPDSPVPHLAGQRAKYLTNQLTAFKSGDRKHDLMSVVAGQLSDDDIANLAAYWSGQAPGSDATIPASAVAIRQTQMTFPKDFPKAFTQYTVANNEDSTVTKRFVNTAGLRAARAKQQLPDGSAIMVVTYQAKLGADGKPIAEKDGTWRTDKITAYAAMEARAGWGDRIPELLRNGNWQYGLFDADKQPRVFNQAACLACHKPVAAKSYVFTLDDIH